MKRLSKVDRSVLLLMQEGAQDYEICIRLRLRTNSLDASIQRIRALALSEADDAGLVYEQALRNRAESNLLALQARFSALMEVLDQAVLVIDGRTGIVKEVNRAACELFGYSRASFQGLSVEALVSEDIRSVHVAYRIGFLTSRRKREMGYHPPIHGLRSDGSRVEMAIALTATPINDDVMVVCTEHSTWRGGVEASPKKKTVRKPLAHA